MSREVIRVLLFEDCPQEAGEIRALLAELGEVDCELEWVQRLSEGLSLLDNQDAGVILLDLSLPDSDGIATFLSVQSAAPCAPIIVLTDPGDHALTARLVRRGAHDYLVKGHMTRQLLGRAIRCAIERQRAEEQLRLLASAVHHADDAVVITSADLDPPGPEIVFVNDAWTRMTGYSGEEATGKTPRLLQGPDTDRAVLDRLRSDLTEGRVFHGETYNYRKDGSLFLNEWHIEPIRDAGGRVTHFLAIQRDVTERRQFEEHFRQAQKMEAIGALASGVAHDFNNVLAVVNGYSELLLERDGLDDNMRLALEEIKRAGERAAALTRQLLAFSRRQRIAPRAVDLNECVTDLEKLLRRLIGEDIDLITELEPVLKPVLIDPCQVEQVLLNLVVNARDAMPLGGRLTLRTGNARLSNSAARAHPSLRPGTYVRLSVIDTGCGISPDVRARMFEPFFTTKDLGKGTGLGLSMVYNIVHQHGGAVVVESEPEQGAAFHVYLPCTRTARVPRARRRAAAVPRGSETVLLVEDETMVRRLIRDMLELGGYRVIEASRGEYALDLCTQVKEPIHLLLADVVMPGMSGGELADWLTGQCRDTKVLLMSGYTEDALAHHGAHLDGKPFLQKPFTTEDLARKVREVLDGEA